jgi:hypothetical protein
MQEEKKYFVTTGTNSKKKPFYIAILNSEICTFSANLAGKVRKLG